jgi:hypothetical protein
MTITKEKIIRMSQHVSNYAYRELLLVECLGSDIAASVAQDAGDAFGNALLRDLPENGVEVKS